MEILATSNAVTLLGGLAVEPPIRLSIPGRRLLVFLAIHGGAAHRWVVADQLWPDQLEAHARASLRRAIWQLPRSWIGVVGDSLELSAVVDLKRARSLANRALSGEALRITDIGCLTLDLLPGWHDEWLVPAQDEFHFLRVQALESLCRTLIRQGDPQLATHAGMAAVAAEPLRESAAEALVVAHLAEGNRYEAVRRYRTLARLLRAELGVVPDAALTERLRRLGLENRIAGNGP